MAESLKLGVDAAAEIADGVVIEVDVGQGGKQAVGQKARHPAALASLVDAGPGKVDKAADQLILKRRRLGLLAADPCSDAAASAGRLLALIAKHL